MVGRYPYAALFLALPSEMVDVNVHPAKAEVRFRQKDRVFSGVQRAVRTALMAYSPVPAVEPGMPWSSNRVDREPGDPGLVATDPFFGGYAGHAQEQRSQTEAGSTDELSQSPLPRSDVPLLRLVGQVGAAFLVAEAPDGLYLIDQHAAHERVLFERFMAQRRSEIAAQTLLEPVAVQLPPPTARLLEEQLPTLGRLGFDVELFGPGTFLVRALPELLLGLDPEKAVRVLVEDFEEDERPLGSEVEARLIARVCKRAAVKAGKVLSQEEQRALLRDLEACKAPRTCPHGRPTMVHLSLDLLERQFGRRGPR